MRFWPFRGRPAAAPPPANDLLATEELLRKNVEDLLVVRERQIRGGVIVFRGELLLSPSRAVDALLERFRVFGYTPFIHADGDGVVVQAWPLAEVVERPRVAVNVVLFVLTCASTLVAGTMFSGSPTFDAFRSASGPAWLLSGVPFACTLLAILGVHEFGHYFTARHYGAQVSLPFFIPAPPPLFLFGTMGAIIRMRSPARDRNSLFDIAAAGPLAGLAVARPARGRLRLLCADGPARAARADPVRLVDSEGGFAPLPTVVARLTARSSLPPPKARLRRRSRRSKRGEPDTLKGSYRRSGRSAIRARAPPAQPCPGGGLGGGRRGPLR